MIIKSVAELNELKEKAKDKFMIKKEDTGKMKIVVGMATCGIAAGANPVMSALTDEIESKKLDNVTVAQAGCIGICQYEPIIEVYEAGKEKVTYVKMDAERAKKIIDEHIIGGKIVEDYTIGAATASERNKS